MRDDLYSLFGAHAPADRSRPFLERADGTVDRYADLEAESARYANRMLALGIRKGDRVAVQIEKSPEAIYLYLAALRIGAVYLPLNPDYTPSEVGYFLRDAEPELFVCRPETEAALARVHRDAGVRNVETLGADGEGTWTEGAAGLPEELSPQEVCGDDLAAILYTSGTTGRAKGAMLSHANLAANGLALRDLWGFRADDVLVHALPVFHAHGLFVAIHCTLLAGSRLLFLPRFDAGRVIEILPRATVLMGVPTFYTRLLAHAGLTRERCGSIRLFVSGSAPLLAETHREFERRTGHAILERYGMTETGMNTSNPPVGPRIAGSVGPPLPGVEVRVADAAGTVLGGGEIGTLEVRGPNVFRGYWRMPEKTASEFRPDGFFITGDLGRIDEHGYVTIVGRGKDLVISGGLNVYPKEVETVLDAIPGVVESAVFGVPHPDFGEAVVAAVVRAPASTLSEADAIAIARERLATFKSPKRVLFVDELPRNSMGKVQKNLLQERHRALFVRGD